jgi:hypothetical protein
MKNIYLLILLLIPGWMTAQLENVSVDIRQGYFNGGNPLPGEERWRLSGSAPEGANAVRVEIGEKGSLFDLSDYSKEMDLYESETSYEMLMDYPMKTGRDYDFRIVFARDLTEKESSAIQSSLIEASEIYINEMLYSNGNRMKFRERPQEIYRRLNDLVNRSIMPFTEGGIQFSQSLLNHLKTLDGLKLNVAKENVKYEYSASNRDIRKIYFESKANFLKQSISSEIKQLVKSNKRTILMEKDINAYPVEKSTFVLPVNVGYAAIYGSGGFDNLKYDSGLYAGLSLPFGPRQIRDRLSISAGVFLKNIDFGSGNIQTGPIVGRPIYVALGFKALKLLRFNAGTAVLQSNSAATATSQVYLRPMVGAALELNLWAGFGKK